jgi:hypothetical protein
MHHFVKTNQGKYLEAHIQKKLVLTTNKKSSKAIHKS